MRIRVLPLGVDIGTRRIRIASLERRGSEISLGGVAVREYCGSERPEAVEPGYVAAVIADAVAELGVKERRCVCALSEVDATLHPVTYPHMSAGERARAATIEAVRRTRFTREDTLVRLHRVEQAGDEFALGIARKSAVRARVGVLRGSGLRPIAIEHEANAVFRAFPGVSAAIDVGSMRSALHVNLPVPRTVMVERGGAQITGAIAAELRIDLRSAEKRKRIVGTAGAGEPVRRLLIEDLAAAIERARFIREIDRIVLLGNGSRLPALASDLEGVARVRCEIPIGEGLRSEVYPIDVLRSAYADWAIACGLALREAAG